MDYFVYVFAKRYGHCENNFKLYIWWFVFKNKTFLSCPALLLEWITILLLNIAYFASINSTKTLLTVCNVKEIHKIVK